MRRPVTIAVVFVALIVLPACGKTDEKARAAGIAPSESLAFVSVNLDPAIEQKRAISSIAGKFPDFSAQAGDFEEARDKVLGQLAAEVRLNYKLDVEPWLGNELAVAVLPSQGGKEPVAVLMAASKDDDKAKAALEKAKGGGKFGGEFRLVGRFVIVANNEDKAQNPRALDLVERQQTNGSGGLAESDRFRKLVNELNDNRLVLVWADSSALTQANASGSDAQDLQAAQCLGGSTTVAVDLHAEDSAVVLEGVTEGQSSGQGELKLANGLPADSLGAFSAFGVGDLLSRCLGQIPDSDDFVMDTRRETGLDIQADVLAWMRGEVTLVMGPVPSGRDAPDFALLVEPTDRPKAEAAFSKLRPNLLRRGGGFQERRLGDLTALVSTQPEEDGFQPAFALLRDRFVLASRPEYLEVISKPATPGLGSAGVVPESEGGGKSDRTSLQLVVRIDPIREAFEKVMDPAEKVEYEKSTKPNLVHLGTFTFVSRRDGTLDHLQVKLTFD